MYSNFVLCRQAQNNAYTWKKTNSRYWPAFACRLASNIFSWLQTKNPWKIFEMNKKGWKLLKKSISTRFWVRPANLCSECYRGVQRRTMKKTSRAVSNKAAATSSSKRVWGSRPHQVRLQSRESKDGISANKGRWSQQNHEVLKKFAAQV